MLNLSFLRTVIPHQAPVQYQQTPLSGMAMFHQQWLRIFHQRSLTDQPQLPVTTTLQITVQMHFPAQPCAAHLDSTPASKLNLGHYMSRMWYGHFCFISLSMWDCIAEKSLSVFSPFFDMSFSGSRDKACALTQEEILCQHHTSGPPATASCSRVLGSQKGAAVSQDQWTWRHQGSM